MDRLRLRILWLINRTRVGDYRLPTLFLWKKNDSISFPHQPLAEKHTTLASYQFHEFFRILIPNILSSTKTLDRFKLILKPLILPL